MRRVKTALAEMVDVVAIGPGGRDSSSRRVRLHDEAVTLEGGQIVADRGSREGDPGVLEDRARTNRFPGLYVGLHEGAEDIRSTFLQHPDQS